MRSSSSESGSEVSEDEYEVEFILGARWNGTVWEYEVHWYMYDSDNDTWEPEENLTKYGSAELVNRFWKEWPGKRRSRPVVGTGYRASPDLLIEERKRFLANRPKNKSIKGVERPSKQSNKPVLVGDPESDDDDDDILVPTDEEDDEDILHTSSSDDVPLNKISRNKSARASFSAGAGSKAPLKASSAGKQPVVPKKPLPARPSVSNPAIPTASAPRKNTYPSPAVKTTKVARAPVVQPRRGRAHTREDMPAGSISKDFGGIGTKGKQAERAGEIVALGRRGSESTGPAPAPKPTNAYAGISMRKAGQASAPNISTGAGPSRVGSGTPVDSPMEMSPVGMQQHHELPTTQLVDDFVSSIQAEVRPEPESPRDSLFDEDEEDQPAPQMDADIDFGQFAINSPPRAPEPALPPEPQPEPRGPPTRPSVSMDFPPVHNHLDNHAQPYTPSPLVQGLPLQSPVSAIPPLQAGQWHWKGDLYVTTEEPIPGADNDSEGKPKTKAAHHRVCGVVIRDPALPDDTGTKIFTSTLASYVKDKITIQNTSDLHILYAELGAGAFELTQAAWMISPDADEGPDFDLWRGIIRKMEITIQGSIVKIYNANGAQMTRHLLLVPCSLMRKFRRLAPFAPVVEHFKSRTEGLAVIMCKRVQNVVDPEPRPFLAQQIPKYWQQIPPELHSQLKGVKCLVFPHPDAEPESGLLHAELAKCNAIVMEGFDTRGEAEAVFVHRGWVWQLSGLLGLTHRRKRLFRRFYAFGSGGLWRAAEWDVREIWLFGGMVTFTPAALLEDPWIVNKIIEMIKDNVTWHAYIEPKVIGTLTLRQTDDEITFALERVLDEIAFSNDFAPYPLALTSPPRHGFFEEFEWVDAQYARADKTSEGLRTSCEEEVINAYKKELEEAPKTTQPVKAKSKEPETNGGGWGDANGQGGGGGEGWGASNGNNEGSWGESNGGGGGDGGGWGDSTSNGNAGWGESSGGWGNSSGAANGWGSPAQNPPGSPTQTALPRSNAGTPAPHDGVDLSQIATDKRIRELSDDVIEGLKTMQIQPCFMREIRRFIVIDSKARAKEKKERESKLEVEVITAEQFIKEFTENS